jgi:hypothetical protein
MGIRIIPARFRFQQPGKCHSRSDARPAVPFELAARCLEIDPLDPFHHAGGAAFIHHKRNRDAGRVEKDTAARAILKKALLTGCDVDGPYIQHP